MMTRIFLLCLLLVAGLAHAAPMAVRGESVVLAGVEPARLWCDQIAEDSVQVRSTYLADAPGATVYEAGKDYVVDAAAGMIARTAGSRIPDFSTNVLYGQKTFDHSKFPGYGNLPFFAYVDYTAEKKRDLVEPADQTALLAKSITKLQAGGPFKVITFGDSISAGGEASARALCFDERYADFLRATYPKAEITVENGATGGDATVQGLARLEEKVLSRAPDLVLVGFGMNDHNVGSVPLDAFEENLVSIAKQVKERTGADVLMFSAFPPHPDWKHSSHRMDQYAAATRRAAERVGAAYADVYAAWMKLLERKEPASLLANNINHPNDFGHWLYFVGLRGVHGVAE